MLSGCIGVWLAVQNDLVGAAIFVGLGIFFDFFDGLAARKIGVAGELGTQLDSMADVITSGLVPSIVMVQLLKGSGFSDSTTLEFAGIPWFAFIGFLIAIASGFRLAKFNIDERQTTSFIGLPTPANGILILSFDLIQFYQPDSFLAPLATNLWFLIGLTLISSYLLNSELRLFSLKIEGLGWTENRLRYCFLLISILLLIFLQFQAIPLVILFYILVSLFATDQS
jgi:CDP-diacylglycerol--serine O-phosphatidyltransferase